MKVGAVVNILGVAVTAEGLRQTWRDFGTPGETLWQPVAAQASRALRRFVGWVRRVLRRPRHHTVSAGAALGAGGALDATVRTSWAPFPDPGTDPAAFGAEVEQRLRQLHDTVQDAGEQLVSETKARSAADEQTRVALHAEIQQVHTYAQHIAVNGVRIEAVGLFLVAAGTALSLIG